MAWQQSDLDALETALAKGVRRVRYSDKEVEYQSIDDMIKVRELMRQQLSVTTRPQRIYARFSKGLRSTCDSE